MADVTLRTVPDPPLRATALLYFAELARGGGGGGAAGGGGRGRARDHGRGVAALAGRRPRATRSRSATRTAALLVEFREPDAAALDAAVARARRRSRPFRLLARRPTSRTDPAERDAHWRLRKGLFPSVGGMRPSGTAVVIEDVVVPRGAAGRGHRPTCRRCSRRHGFDDAIVFGHARDGNLHFVFAQDFARPGTWSPLRRVHARAGATWWWGSTTARSRPSTAPGRNMAPFVRDEWGDEAYALMRRVKAPARPRRHPEPGRAAERRSRGPPAAPEAAARRSRPPADAASSAASASRAALRAT